MSLSAELLHVQAEERREQLQALYQLALEIAELHDVQQVLDLGQRRLAEAGHLELVANLLGLRLQPGRVQAVGLERADHAVVQDRLEVLAPMQGG